MEWCCKTYSSGKLYISRIQVSRPVEAAGVRCSGGRTPR